MRREERKTTTWSVLALAGAVLTPMVALGQIATGPDSAIDGYLAVTPDEYGAWASAGFGGGGDAYNPAGAFGSLEAAFTSGFFLFTPNGRDLLTDNASWRGVIGGGDGSLSRTITAGNLYSDTTGNGINDTSMSAFEVTGAGVDLGFQLTQHVNTATGAVSYLRQDYTITNNGPDGIAFSMVRAFDGDLLWSGDFADDEVGTGANGAGVGPYVFQEEVGDPSTAITLSSMTGNDYYGGKNGIDPGGAGLPFAFGTDVQVWDNLGVPDNWRNYVAGVGYDTDGVSGAMPPGVADPADGFMGMDFVFELAAGQSVDFSVWHTYGSNMPVPTPGSIALIALAGAGMAGRRRR